MSQGTAAPVRPGQERPGARVPPPRLDVAIVASLTAAALALRVAGMDEGLFRDELFTYAETDGLDLLGVLDAVATGGDVGLPVENTPPLHFVLAWLSRKLGEPTTWIRLPSVLLGAATVPLVWALGLRTADRAAALVAAGLTALSPFAIFYGVEARAYGTAMFFSALSTLLLLRAVESRRPAWWVAYAAAVTALLYTHYTGGLVVAAQAAWVLMFYRDRWRALALAIAGMLVALAPWLPYVKAGETDYQGLAQLQGVNRWEAFLQWVAGVPDLLPDVMPGSRSLLLLAFALAVGLAGALVAGRRKALAGRPGWQWPSRSMVLILMLAAASPLGLLVVAFVGEDLFIYPRNMSASWPLAAVALGWAVTPPSRPFAVGAVALVAVAMVPAAAKTLREPYQRPNFPEAASIIDGNSDPADRVVQYGVGFSPFILGDTLPLYYDRRHATRGSSPGYAGVARAFGPPRSASVYVVELREGDGAPPPVVLGWQRSRQWTLSGTQPISVAQYRPLRPWRAPASLGDRVQGRIDAASLERDAAILSGWALAPGDRPVDQLMAFDGDRLVAAGLPALPRADIAAAHEISAQRLGFALAVPRRSRARLARVRVVARAGRDASALATFCGPAVRQTLSC